MFRTLTRALLPNRLDWLCKCARRSQKKKILLGWNRGMGDVALGLFAIVHRIRQWIPDAKITFLVRQNLADAFSLLQGVEVLLAPDWKRGEPYDIQKTLAALGRRESEFDLTIAWPNPTHWVHWQHGKLVPKLTWNPAHDDLWKKFDLPEGFSYIGVQAVAETNYGLWRNWPEARWKELFAMLERRQDVRILLFGLGRSVVFEGSQIIDLRGELSLFELLSIIKNRCSTLIVPDSGILTLTYYLDVAFPLKVISLWGDPNHGILKQAVASPNPDLEHKPLIGALRNLSTVTADDVLCEIR